LKPIPHRLQRADWERARYLWARIGYTHLSDFAGAPESHENCGIPDLGCMPNPESGLYFSGVTYTTLGYGDHLLPKPWRILAPLEALTGILMCGLSAGLFFAVVTRFISNWVKGRR
jgi:hypothetical protein